MVVIGRRKLKTSKECAGYALVTVTVGPGAGRPGQQLLSCSGARLKNRLVRTISSSILIHPPRGGAGCALRALLVVSY